MAIRRSGPKGARDVYRGFDSQFGLKSQNPLDLVNLGGLLRLTQGASWVTVGLIDGPAAFDHPDLNSAKIREIRGSRKGGCSDPATVARTHSMFVAGILSATRGALVPAICPCTLLIRPSLPKQPLVGGADAGKKG